MNKITNKKAYFICFIICLIYFSFLIYKTVQDGSFFNSPIATSLLFLIGIVGMPRLMYCKIVEPFIQIKT